MNTIAVGPFEPVGTGVGATVALPLLHCKLHDERTNVAGVIEVVRLAARESGIRRAIVKFATRGKVSSRSVVGSCVKERPEQPCE